MVRVVLVHQICRARNRIGLIRARVVLVYQICRAGGIGLLYQICSGIG